MIPFSRADRVSGLIQEVLSELLKKKKVLKKGGKKIINKGIKTVKPKIKKGVKKTGVGLAIGGHAADGGQDHLVHNAPVQRLGDHRRR